MSIHMRFAAVGSIASFALLLTGCPSESGPKRSMSDVGSQIESQNAAQQQTDQAKAEADQKAKEAAAAAASQPPAEAPRTEAGRAPIGEGGYLVAIAGARRHVLNRVDDLAWTQAVQHFQATEGRLPKDHQEFMTKVIEPNGIDLGFKEEGQEFLYDPTPDSEHPWGTLYVVASEDAAAPPAGAPQ
jgi:hypothetical protein